MGDRAMKTSLFFTAFLTTIIFSTIGYSQNVLVEIEHLRPARLEMGGFQINSNQEVNIEAVGLHQKSGRHEIILGSAWILNASTREVVWIYQPTKLRRYHLEVKEQKDKMNLTDGNYEVYYSTYPYFRQINDHYSYRGIGHFISNFFDNFFDNDYDYNLDDYDYYDDFADKFKILVEGKGKKLDKREVEKIQENLRKEAAISLKAFKDNLYLTQGFEIKNPVDINIYAIGEARKDGNFDYGWIINTETREKIWKLDYYESEHAGGSNKNRMVNETLSLPPGRYAAVYITDDSHSPHEWNSAVPYDPAFWGLTINLKNPTDNQYLSKFDYHNIDDNKILYSLNRLHDDDYEFQGFILKKPMDLRVYAIGEGRDGEMFDYGWIVDANTHKKVWEMDYYDTDHAGGSQKNRLIDQTISLEKGNYIAYFATDGSHSYGNWNDSQPYDPDHWGLTILAANENFSRNDISDYQERANKNVLAQITRVRNDENIRDKFSLKKDSEVRIYAIGEGTDGSMYDYGWIEDSNSGRVVWDMSYRRTNYAGGARKNRLIDDTISLPKGEYEVFYESDDSHSFNDWNDAPPWDLMNWGISVYLIQER